MPWKRNKRPTSLNGNTSVRTRTARKGRAQRTRRTLPTLEMLEDRTLLATFSVTNLDDAGAGSLRQAIEDANANAGPDQITFARGLSGEIVLTSGELEITDDLTIDGPGADRLSVSGNNSSRVFAVIPAAMAGDALRTPTPEEIAAAPSLAMSDLAVMHGLASDALGFDPDDPTNPGFSFGGGIYNLGGSVELTSVAMSNNVATGVVTAGGAVANEFGGTLTVSRSEFSENVSGGFLIAVGGAITSDLGPTTEGLTGQPTVNIERSEFINNTAQAQAGYIEGVGFSGLGAGGALLNVTGHMTVNRSHFEGNVARGGTGAEGSTSGGGGFGGAILTGDASPFGVAESTLTVTRSTFIENTAGGGAGGFEGLDGGYGAGGAISVGNGSDGMLSHNTFTDNAALGGDAGDGANGGLGAGGGVHVSGGAVVEMTRNRVMDNTAWGGAGSEGGFRGAGRGGGVSLDSVILEGFAPFPGSGSSTHDTIEGNVAAGGIGGGIFNEGTLSIDKTRISNNHAMGLPDSMITFVPAYVFHGGGVGGGISNLGTVDVNASTIDGNQATGADGVTGPNVILGESEFATYPGLATGGGIHNVGTATIGFSRFLDNVSHAGDGNTGTFSGVSNGGGVLNDGTMTLSMSRVDGNQSIGGDDNTGDLNVGGGYGGGVSSGTVAALAELRTASLIVDRSMVRNNTTMGGTGNTSVLDLTESQAHAAGGATGGGILAYQGSVEVSRTNVSGNKALGGDGLGGGGGVFFLSFIGSLDATLTRSQIGRNEARGGNGADGIGGGLLVGAFGSFFGAPSTTEVSRTLFYNNLAEGGEAADGLGGGIFNDGDSLLELTGSLIFSNDAQGGVEGGEGVGGGLYNLGTIDLIRSRIFANWASDDDDDCFGC